MIVELPDKDELVVGIIKKIMPYGAFCSLPEYNNIEAFLHVSEVAPRWIKNIHEFISEGQRHIIKVIHVDKEKNQVDVSIKRVSEEEKKQKLEFFQNQKRGDKLFELSAKMAGLKVDDASALKSKIESEFGDLYSCFKELSFNGESAVKDLELPSKLKDAMFETAKKNIKKPIYTVSSTISLTCYGPTGVEELKKMLDLDGVSVHYLGSPRYRLSLTAPDYKTGDKKLRQLLERIKDLAQKRNCDFKVAEEKK